MKYSHHWVFHPFNSCDAFFPSFFDHLLDIHFSMKKTKKIVRHFCVTLSVRSLYSPFFLPIDFFYALWPLTLDLVRAFFLPHFRCVLGFDRRGREGGGGTPGKYLWEFGLDTHWSTLKLNEFSSRIVAWKYFSLLVIIEGSFYFYLDTLKKCFFFFQNAIFNKILVFSNFIHKQKKLNIFVIRMWKKNVNKTNDAKSCIATFCKFFFFSILSILFNNKIWDKIEMN